MINGTCHCGAVSFDYPTTPEFAVACNCSACRRYGAHWIYETADKIKISGETLSYSWGDKDLAFHSCKICGVTTHWSNRNDPVSGRMAVNLKLADPDVAKPIPIRPFDGADTWEFLD